MAWASKGAAESLPGHRDGTAYVLWSR